MTKNESPVNGPVALKNVAAFMVMTQRLIDRDPMLDGLGVFSGPSGYGKSVAAIYAQNKTRAIRVEVGDSWNKKTLLLAILGELRVKASKNLTIADLADMCISALGEEPSRPLIVDEADRLLEKRMLELLRELLDRSGVPVIMIGEERLPTNLLAIERVHNRVQDWTQAQPCDFEDTQLLAAAYCGRVSFSDDVLETIRVKSDGRARRIVNNVSHLSNFARNRGIKALSISHLDEVKISTGAPPAVRPVSPFYNGKAVAA